MQKKYLKLLIIFLLAGIFLQTILSITHNCEDKEHCFICQVIKKSEKIISPVVTTIIYIFSFLMIAFILIKKEILKETDSPIHQKVRLNL